MTKRGLDVSRDRGWPPPGRRQGRGPHAWGGFPSALRSARGSEAHFAPSKAYFALVMFLFLNLFHLFFQTVFLVKRRGVPPPLPGVLSSGSWACIVCQMRQPHVVPVSACQPVCPRPRVSPACTPSILGQEPPALRSPFALIESTGPVQGLE